MTDIHTIHKQRPACRIEGCDKPRRPKRTLCATHLQRWQKWKDFDYVAPLGPARTDPSERFWSKVILRGSDECWLYQGQVLSGYGRFRVSPEFQTYAHRYAYTDRVGPIPDGLTIDHLCCVKLCVNPAHMELVTGAENTRRRWVRERAASA